MTRSTRHHDGACCRDRTYLVNHAAGNGEREQNADDTDYLPGVVWAVQLAVSAESLLGVPGATASSQPWARLSVTDRRSLLRGLARDHRSPWLSWLA